MPLLSPDDAKAVQEQFQEKITRPVKMIVVTTEGDCMYCNEVKMLAEELAELSPLISVEAYDLEKDKPVVELYGIDKAPAIVVVADGRGEEPDIDYGIRFYGIPSGYEFMSLLDALYTVGSDGKDLQIMPETLEFLKSLDKDLHIQVFITPTCPYCPRAVMMAHHFAFVSPRVKADMVEAMEFPELSNRYHVYGVPRTVINEVVHQEGAVPEPMMLQKLREAVAATPA
jgi:glutaredoxin-like protein